MQPRTNTQKHTYTTHENLMATLWEMYANHMEDSPPGNYSIYPSTKELYFTGELTLPPGN